MIGLIGQSLAGAAAPRFTRDGDDPMEARLQQTCASLVAGLRGLIPASRLEAVLLGGGYGRGEGGVLPGAHGDQPYNDLEFYVCVRGNRHLNERRHHLPLEVLGEILSPIAGVEIEFKLTSLADLRRSRISMFSYDLLLGHRWLWGDPAALASLAHHRHAAAIPAAEITRLLLNRCTGLLLAQERLERPEFTASDADFVQRNLAKAELAFGDAVLAAHGQYHWSCGERQCRLARLHPTAPPDWLDEVRRRHVLGVAFKLHPHRSLASQAALAARHAGVVALGLEVWLWQENRRLGTAFRSAADYVTARADLCPETSGPRNALVGLKLGGPRALLRPTPFRHPREPVLRSLCALLWLPREAAPPGIHRSITATGAPFSARISAYRAHWSRVN